MAGEVLRTHPFLANEKKDNRGKARPSTLNPLSLSSHKWKVKMMVRVLGKAAQCSSNSPSSIENCTRDEKMARTLAVPATLSFISWGSSRQPVTPAQGDPKASSGFLGHCPTQAAYIHIYIK